MNNGEKLLTIQLPDINRELLCGFAVTCYNLERKGVFEKGAIICYNDNYPCILFPDGGRIIERISSNSIYYYLSYNMFGRIGVSFFGTSVLLLQELKKFHYIDENEED